MPILANKQYLILISIVGFLVLLFIISRAIRKKALKRFGDNRLLSVLMPEVSESRPVIKFVMLIVGMIALIIAIARPQYGSKLKEEKQRGIEIIVALDVSNSMLAQDVQPNRLENAKLAISKLIEKLGNDKIGLIVFAGDAYVQIPITTDYSATELFLESINTGIVPKQGTAIGSAIEMAMKAFTPEEDMSKAIVIITDGENHEDDAIEMAKKAAEKGIYVYTIGMGSPDGSPIPIPGRSDFRRDRNGQIIVSKMNPEMLRGIAQAGNGVFVQANNTTSALKTIYTEINQLDKAEIKVRSYAEYDEKFQIFLAIALFFIALEFFILDRKNRLFKNIKLFD